jgi:LacI family transcriptional regulator
MKRVWISPMATQKDVADRAGVSFITVSRVVNNLGNVKPETRVKVEEAIRDLHYHPNRQAQALNNGLTHTLALVTPRMFDRPLFNNYYVMSLLSGVEMRGRELGWDVLMSTDFDHEGEFDFLRVWHQRKVDGLIFVGLKRFPGEQIREIETKGIPCVSISDRIESPAISWVDTRNDEAAADAVRRLAHLGHRHFAYLGVDLALDYNPNFRDREVAVRRTVAELGLELDVFAAGTMDNAGEVSPRLYLSRKKRATAVISGNDSVAMNFIAAVGQAGLTCPRDFSIVGFDAEPAGRMQVPSLASYRQPLLDMGQASVSVLVNQMTGFRKGKVENAFPLEFVEGGSLAPVPGR